MRFWQVITFGVGLTLAVTFNVNSIAAAQQIFVEPTVRARLVQAAEKRV